MTTPTIDPLTLREKQRGAIEVEITIKPKKI